MNGVREREQKNSIHEIRELDVNDGNRFPIGQKFQKVENDENRFFAITSSKLFKN